MALTKVQTIGIETGISLTGVTTVTTLNASTDTLSVGGTVNFGGNVSIAGTLTYEDVTNVDSVGIITARSGVNVTGGSVGIGTDSPVSGVKLHLQDTSACRLQLSTNNTGHTSSDGVRLMIDGSNNFEILQREEANIEFFTNNTERARIDSSGRLLLGTTTEGYSSADDLTIATSGDTGITIRSGTSNEGNIFFSDGTSGNTEYRGAVRYYHDVDELEFMTAASGRMRIDSSGNFGLGTASPGRNLVVNSGASSGYIQLVNTNSGTAASNGFELKLDSAGAIVDLINRENGAMRFFTNNTQRMQIDSSGRLLVGATSARENYFSSASGQALQFQIEGTEYKNSAASFTSNSTSAGFGPHLAFGRSRGTTIGSNTLVNDGDTLGVIVFHGNDGSKFVQCARIDANVDGTPGSDDMPGRLLFQTTADGANSPTERMRIDSSGRLLLGTTTEGQANADNLTIADSGNCGMTIRTGTSSQGALFFSDATSGTGEYDGFITYDQGTNAMRLGTAANERMRIDSSGRLLLNHNSSINNAGVASKQQITGDSAATASLSIRRDANSSSGPLIIFGKSRSGALGNNVSVANNDNIGSIVFAAADGTDVSSQCAEIKAQIDGTPGSNDTPGRLVFMTASDGSNAPTERMRITSEGKIGIGHDSPQFGLTLQQTNNDSGKIGWEDSGSSKRASITCNTSTDALEFRTGTGDAERANISSKGSFVIRASTGTGSGHSSLANANDVGFYNDGASLGQVLIMGNTYGGGKGYVGFYYNTTSNVIGSINAQGSGGSSTSGVNFNTSSDYRLKENIVDMTDGITRVKQLLPRRFNFITDETNTLVDGFIAHEAQAVVPQAVSGEHNEVDENGDPVMQGMDYGKLTPLLTAALQEAIAEIETLKARLDAAGL